MSEKCSHFYYYLVVQFYMKNIYETRAIVKKIKCFYVNLLYKILEIDL